MEISIRTQDEIKVVKLRGDVKLGESVDQLTGIFNELFTNSSARIVLDLEEVPTIDSSGIGAMVRALTMAKKQGGSIKLLKPSKFVLQTLKMVSLLKLFNTYDDLQAALSSFQ